MEEANKKLIQVEKLASIGHNNFTGEWDVTNASGQVNFSQITPGNFSFLVDCERPGSGGPRSRWP